MLCGMCNELVHQPDYNGNIHTHLDKKYKAIRYV